MSFFAPLADAGNISLNCNNLSDREVIINSDETKINQVLTNLISNAIKFTSSGGIDFGFEIKNDFVEFYVKDTGIGIPKEYYQNIFDRFTQVDLQFTQGYEGAGLGLAICKGLVELLGGKIWLESEINIGTTFYFTIPYEESAATETATEKPATPKNRTNSKILIAEDDFTSYQYLNQVLTNSRILAIHAVDGEQAVEFVKKTPDISLILMDVKMPKMNGIDATKEIKKLNPAITVIAQTAYAFSTERDEILAAGCSDYISKPVPKEKLLALIEKYL